MSQVLCNALDAFWRLHLLIICISICFITFSDMSWFGNAIPLISMGKKTVKQPVCVSIR